MKVLLIMPYHTDLIHAVSLPLGILSIASYLEKNGYEVKIADFSVRRTSVRKVYESFRPDIVGLSFPSVKAIDGIVRISKFFKQKNIPVVWGGSFVDVGEIQHFFQTGMVDILSFCEGEATWLDLLRTIEMGGDLSGVKGIAYLRGGEIVATPPRPFMDPAELPRLNFDLLDGLKDYYHYLYGCNHLVYVYLSKGCPAHCTFCVNTLCHRNTRRRRPLDVFMEECKAAGFEPNIASFANDPGRRIDMVEAGLGIALISKSGLSYYLKNQKIAALPLKKPFYKNIVVARKKGVHKFPALCAFWNYVQQFASGEIIK